MFGPSWDSERRQKLRTKIANSTPEGGSCPTCRTLFEGTEAACWLIVAAEGVMPDLDQDATADMMAGCPNSEVVELVKQYRAGL